jgi:hypothetical protein
MPKCLPFPIQLTTANSSYTLVTFTYSAMASHSNSVVVQSYQRSMKSKVNSETGLTGYDGRCL